MWCKNTSKYQQKSSLDSKITGDLNLGGGLGGRGHAMGS